MKLFTYGLGALKTNAYVLVNEETRDAVAIDIGGNSAIIQLEELKNNFHIKAVLLTHCHFDHIGGVYEFYKRGATVYIGENEVENLKDEEITLEEIFGEKVEKFEVKPLKNGEKINLFGFEFTVIYTPGHTFGSVCYLYEDIIFSGDTLFNGSFGRYDFPTGDIDMLKNSIKSLYKYKDKKVLSGHGESTTIENEIKNNPINYYL